MHCLHKQKYLEHIKTQGQIIKTCKQLVLLLITYWHWRYDILSTTNNILTNKILYHIYYIYITIGQQFLELSCI